MTTLVRFSTSIERPLYRSMEKLLRKSGYSNRSEFVRDIIRERLVQEEWKLNEDAVGTITIIFDHHKRQLSERLLDLQHDHHRDILASTHVHLDHDRCVETILVKGRAQKIEELANMLRKEKGVLHASLSLGSTGKQLA
jgi:CopG family nickel-responsive transcriptional regulator